MKLTSANITHAELALKSNKPPEVLAKYHYYTDANIGSKITEPIYNPDHIAVLLYADSIKIEVSTEITSLDKYCRGYTSFETDIRFDECNNDIMKLKFLLYERWHSVIKKSYDVYVKTSDTVFYKADPSDLIVKNIGTDKYSIDDIIKIIATALGSGV